MLQQSMDNIAQCAAKEVSSLSNSEEQLSDHDIITKEILTEMEQEDSGSQEEEEGPEETRELRHPLSSKLITHSDESECDGVRTPPYLSPGVTRRVNLTGALIQC